MQPGRETQITLAENVLNCSQTSADRPIRSRRSGMDHSIFNTLTQSDPLPAQNVVDYV